MYYEKMYLKDVNFRGKTKNISIFVANGSIGDNPPPSQFSWYFRIDNISENGYKYEKTQPLYDENEGNPFAEPVQVFTNVNNGNGIFKLSYSIIDSLK
jgi:hypothetical protein